MSKILIGGVVTVVVGFILAATSWNFAATQDSVSKKEHTPVHQRLDDKIDKVQETVDDIKDLILDLHTGKDRNE